MFKLVPLLALVPTLALALIPMRPGAFKIPQQSLYERILYNPSSLSENSKSWRSTVTLITDQGLCTGTFVSYNLVLTAKHCFEESTKQVSQIVFYRGSEVYDASWPLEDETKITLHSSLDLALVKFSESMFPSSDYTYMSIVTQTELGSFYDLYERDLFVIGSGLSNISDDYFLGFAKGRLSNMYGDAYNGSFIGRQGGCGGDSGGPVNILVNGHYYLVGVHISGNTNLSAEKKCGTQFNFVPLSASISDWISRHY